MAIRIAGRAAGWGTISHRSTRPRRYKILGEKCPVIDASPDNLLRMSSFKRRLRPSGRLSDRCWTAVTGAMPVTLYRA